MKQSDSIAKLAAALVAAQAELRAVGMDAVNPHFKSKYASLDNIIETIRPTLAKHGLAVVQGTTTPESDASNTVRGFTVETMLVHASGEWLTSAIVMPLGKADPQGAGAALTYGRRYGLSALLSLATDEDDDGNAASKQRTTASRSTGAAGAPNGARQSGQSAMHTTTPATQPTEDDPGAFIKPFGRGKDGPISNLSVEDLQGGIKFARDKNIHPEFIAAAEKYLAALGVTA